MTTSTAPPTTVAHQKIGSLALAELTTLRYNTPTPEGGGGAVWWPMAARPIADTLGLVGNIAPGEVTDARTMSKLGYVRKKLAEGLGDRVELRPLVALV